ncbi:metal transporter family protein [Striga asiatica]|uniref:Metal transporter family protein n=1 Tax=Striga asiatica TaxID=4170 RepID=A0A5A7QUR3_STRAF|nr:metal transporter family protein [Striga asiatica]
MGPRVKWTILFLFFMLVLSLAVTAQHIDESSQRITAPKRNAGSGVIDGSGLEHIVNSDKSVNGMGEWQVGNSRVSVSTVALFTLAMAAATGLGAVPFFFLELDPQWAGICNGMAAGVMLAASFDLIQEGQGHGSGSWVVLGILAGGIFIWLCKKFLEQYGEVSMLDIKGADAAKVILVVGIMTLHSFGEGSGVGVSFAGSKGLSQGLLVTLAIAVHNIPEGLAVSMVLASRGVSPQKAMLWSVITSLPQPIVAVPSFICADAFNKFLPFATGFAAGCMIWMVMAEVLPDGFKESSPSHVASAATLSVAFMEALGALFEHFSHSYNPLTPVEFYPATCEQHATTLAPSDKYEDVAQPQAFSVQRATDEMQSDIIWPFQTSLPHPAHQATARSFRGTVALDRGTSLHAAMDRRTRPEASRLRVTVMSILGLYDVQGLGIW